MTEETTSNINVDQPIENPPIVMPPEITPQAAAVATKKDAVDRANLKDKEGVYTLVNGNEIKLLPVAANIMIEAQQRIPDPEMRTFTDPKTGKLEPNPGHPEYIRELAEVQMSRSQASMDALLLFGIELLFPVPTENLWLEKLKFMKLITDEEYSSVTVGEDKFLRELFYKKYVVMDATILSEVMALSGVTPEMVAQARKSFPSNKSGSTD